MRNNKLIRIAFGALTLVIALQSIGHTSPENCATYQSIKTYVKFYLDYLVLQS